MVLLLAVKWGLLVSLEFAPQMYTVVRYVDTPIVIALAFVVGGRFADGGWPRWLGIVLVFLIMFVLPLIILFAADPQPGGPNPLDAMPSMMWIATVALVLC